MQHYNFALVFVGFQRCCVFLSIIKELSKLYSIAIFPQEIDKKTSSRINNTNKSFLKLCEQFGAVIIYSEKITADIEILPQTHYSRDIINNINQNIISKETFWLSGLAMGNGQYEYLYGKKIDSILVVDRQFYDYRICEYEENKVCKFDDDEILEIGVPYKKYPIFPKFEVDYIIANPTPFSFCTIKDRLFYLENVSLLLEKLDDDDIVALKPHNADERADYIVDKTLYSIISLYLSASLHPFVDKLSRLISSSLPQGKFTDFFIKISIAILYSKIMSRALSLKDITEWHNLNLELFLPNVKKGLITGRSNSIWHGLYLKKPTYNCIDKDIPYYSETKMHKYSMKYLNVHGNYKNLKFDNDLYGKITDQTRNVDMISILKSKLQSLT